MNTLEEFILGWQHFSNEWNMRDVRVLGKASIYANFFTIEISQYDKSIIIRLYLNLKNTIYEVGYVFLEDISGVDVINESIS